MNPSCKNFQALIIDLQQGDPLPPKDREALERHLATCPDCRAFQQDIIQMFKEMGDETLPYLPDEFFQDMREKILHGLHESAPRRIHWARHFPNPFQSGWFSWRKIFVPVLTGICGVLLGFFLATTRTPSHPTPKSIVTISKIQETVVQKSPNALALVETLEDYITIDEFLDSLDDRDIQALLGELSDDLPESLLSETENGTG